MLPETEMRIVKALKHTETPWWFIAREWQVSERTILRIAKKHGVRHPSQRWRDKEEEAV